MDEDNGYSIKTMQQRDKKRWEAADQDQDKQLSKEEFCNFLHPEDAQHMKHIVVEVSSTNIDASSSSKQPTQNSFLCYWFP